MENITDTLLQMRQNYRHGLYTSREYKKAVLEVLDEELGMTIPTDEFIAREETVNELCNAMGKRFPLGVAVVKLTEIPEHLLDGERERVFCSTTSYLIAEYDKTHGFLVVDGLDSYELDKLKSHLEFMKKLNLTEVDDSSLYGKMVKAYREG